MSYEVGNGKELLGQFASGGGYADFVAAVEGRRKLAALRSLVEHGVTEDVQDVVEDIGELIDAVDDEDVVSTADALRRLIFGEDVIVITNGMAPDDGVEKRISGNSPIGLSPEGAKLAQKLGDRIAAKGGLDLLWSSVLRRGVETAKAIESRCNCEYAKTTALCPWHLGSLEGTEDEDAKDMIAHYVAHPSEVPPGKGADGGGAETFDQARRRQLDFFKGLLADLDLAPTVKIGVVMHSRGMELLRAWVDDGCPGDLRVDEEDLVNPDDPEHATVTRLHKGELRDVDLDEDDMLKPGIYLVMHSLTADDDDAGNAEELDKMNDEPVAEMMYHPPLDVHKAARTAYDAGSFVEGITEPLAHEQGIPLRKIETIRDAFAANPGMPPDQIAALGGLKAKIWADRVLRKVDRPVVEKIEDVEKAGNGVMLAFWPDPDLAPSLAVPGGEAPEELHVTLGYFGKLTDMPLDRLAALEEVAARFTLGEAPVRATVGGLGVFPASPSSDGRQVAYRAIESGEIRGFRERLVEALDAAGVSPRKNFDYTPHMTVKLFDGAPPKVGDAGVPVVFGKLVLSVGGAKKEYALDGEDAPKFSMEGDFVKVDKERQLVFGWFSIIQVEGREVEDTQGDVISEEDLENAGYEFVLDFRAGGEMHGKDDDGDIRQVGRVVESCVFTREKVAAMVDSLHRQGIMATIDLRCVAWWGGFRVDDLDAWDGVKSGRLKAWSVGGSGQREKRS